MKEEKKKDLVEMFMELKSRINGRLEFVKTSGIPENEIKIKVYENELFLKIIDKIIDHKIKPIESIETVRGTQYKLGDTFCIAGNENTKYKITYFPDSVTVRGFCKNPEIGKAWTVEAYIEEIFKPKKVKEVRKVKRVKQKEKVIEIKVGDYFSTKTNNTVYKASQVTKTLVSGENKLKSKGVPKMIGCPISNIVLKTKKDFRKQHKAERRFKE
jgi:hypothetical protein